MSVALYLGPYSLGIEESCNKIGWLYFVTWLLRKLQLESVRFTIMSINTSLMNDMDMWEVGHNSSDF